MVGSLRSHSSNLMINQYQNNGENSDKQKYSSDPLEFGAPVSDFTGSFTSDANRPKNYFKKWFAKPKVSPSIFQIPKY